MRGGANGPRSPDNGRAHVRHVCDLRGGGEPVLSLLPFCQTDQQRRVVRAVESVGADKAAKDLGINRRGVQRMVKRLKLIAAQRGHSPDHGMTHTVPEGFKVAGVSTLYKPDGEIAAQWVKSRLGDEDRVAALREAVEDIVNGCKGAARPVKPPKPAESDLLNLFVLTDYHIGMKADSNETRLDDWDTNIAEDLLVRWFGTAIARAPKAETAVLAQLGDLLHWDSLSSVTPTSGHIVDADSRYQRMVRVAVRVLRQVIGMLLASHQRVHVLMCEGNHDMASSAWLREVFAAFYADEPRVTVDSSADPYYCVEHGQTALFFHHGHLKKQDQVDRVFAAKFREAFGRTRHAYAHMGHYHHRREIESALMVVRQHRTLAASDAYASRGGYMSGREAQVITYHREHGEVQTLTISPEAA